MRKQSPLIIALAWITLLGCSKGTSPSDPEHAAPTKPDATPPTLTVDPTIPSIEGSFEDRSATLPVRKPWDNYKAYEQLKSTFTAPILNQQYAAFKEDFVGTLIRTGDIDFQLVLHFYTDGLLSRDKRAEYMRSFLAWIAAQPEAERDQYNINLAIALFQIGFDEEALAFVESNRDASWRKNSWDVNAHTGRHLYRWGRYEESLFYLERAHQLDNGGWNRLWLKLARLRCSGKPAEADDDLLPFGPHLGPDDPAQFPFRDRSKEWGIGSWALAGSVAFFDFDNDTFLDMVQTSSNYSPEFYRFKPGVGFERTEMPPLTDFANLVPGALAADFDNDGYTDLYLSGAAWFGEGKNRLVRNDQGKGFTDMTERGDSALADHKSVSAAALDFDRDGLLDIIVTGMLGGTVRILHNRGDMVFKEVTTEVGVTPDPSRFCVHLTAGDVNNDGWPDFYVNCFDDSELYINQQDGTFKDEAGERGILRGRAAMGFATWMFDYDSDQDLDILAGAFATRDNFFLGGFGGFPVDHFTAPVESRVIWRPSMLYRNDGSGNFTEIGEKAGLITLGVMGGQFIDMELDGKLDIVLGPGSHPLHNIQPLFVYRNNGDDTFTNVVPVSNADYWGKTHGLAFADVDRDGDPDLFVNRGGVMPSDHWPDLFLENTTTGKTWLHVGLKGVQSNTSAIGARVTVHVDGRTLMQERAAGQGFGATNSPYLIFGLDQAQAVEKVDIRWPNGATQTLAPLAANQAIIVTEGSDEIRRIY